MAARLLGVIAASFAIIGLDLTAAEASTPSPGCGSDESDKPELIAVNGRLRHAIVALPDDYTTDEPHVLVFALHGRTNNSTEARGYFGLESASIRPTIHVYPSGEVDESGRFTWWSHGEPAAALRDFALFDALLQAMSDGFCIDLDAVFVVGHSLGASFANSLACSRGDVIRGVASAAGGINPATCVGEVAVMLLHNPEDMAVPVSEGERARDVLLGPRLTDRIERRRRIGAFECDQLRDEPAPVLWCLHDQSVTRRGRHYPHRWPSGMGEAIALFIAELVPPR